MLFWANQRRSLLASRFNLQLDTSYKIDTFDVPYYCSLISESVKMIKSRLTSKTTNLLRWLVKLSRKPFLVRTDCNWDLLPDKV